MLDLVEFGRTGHCSSRVLFGAAALGRMRQDQADAVLDTLLEFGVNHIDTAAAYGESELRIAPWLTRHRDRFFVATKTDHRTGPDARSSLERSLTRLGVDRVDLIQLHNLVEEEEWRTALGPNGAVEALVRARDEGLVRFIGVTGHGLRIAGMHLRSIERFDFDSVLLPCNFVLWQNDGYRRDAELLMERCAGRRIAVQTIKAVARRRWGDNSAPHHSWYEPVTERAALARAVRWVLSRPGIFLNSSSDTSLLRSILEVASGPDSSARPPDADMHGDVTDLSITPLFDGDALERI
ncbi:MAG: aldo/keto reductase [Acidimicrobiales bacterium]